MHKRGYIVLSNSIATAPGGNVTVPLNLNQGLAGPGACKHPHVTKLFVVLNGVTVGAAGADADLDAAFWAPLVSSLTLNASADSPFGKRKGGQIISPMSMYLALTALANMTNSPVMAWGSNAAKRFTSASVATQKSQTAPAAAQLIRRLQGKMHQQGPFGRVKTGDAPITNGQVVFALAIGEKWGEENHMNPIPLSYINGGKDPCASGGELSEGTLQMTLGSTLSGLAVSALTSVQVFAEIVYMDRLNAAALQPYLNTTKTQFETIKIDPMLHGFTALCEDLDTNGNMPLTDVVGVTQFDLTCGGYKPYQPQYPECRAAYVAGNAINGIEHDTFADVDPDGNTAYTTAAEGKTRYDSPWFTIVRNLGKTAEDPAFVDGVACPVTFQLTNATNTTSRRLLLGGWLPQSDEYIAAANDYGGAPVTPNVQLGLSPEKAPLLQAGVPGSSKPMLYAKK